ncbi:MAG TPA: SH3 domain-containing protein, partial [Aggregatilineaceae bacterium]|nr:SH3 domain-containing protein [Aggregatilineaceae bacterium]
AQVAGSPAHGAQFFEVEDFYPASESLWSPDDTGALIVAEGGTLSWFDAASGTLTATPLPAEDGSAPTKRLQWGGEFAFVQWNKQYFVCAYETNTQVDTLDEVGISPLYYDTPLEISISSDGRYVAYTWGYGYRILDWQTGEIHAAMPDPRVEEADRMSFGLAEWVPGYSLVLVGEPSNFPPTSMNYWSVLSVDGQLYRQFYAHTVIDPHPLPASFDLSALAQAPTLPAETSPQWFEAHDGWTGQIAWSSDGQKLVTAQTYDYGPRPGSLGGDPVRVWDAASGTMISELPFGGCGGGIDPSNHKEVYAKRQDEPQLAGYPDNLNWIPGSNLIVMTLYGCWDTPNQLLFWDYTSGEITASYEDVRAFAFSADGMQIALGYEGGSVSIQPYPMTGDEIARLTLNSPARYLEFSADQTRLVAVSHGVYEGPQAELSVWDITQPDQPLFTPLPASDLKSISFTPDGTTLAVTILPNRCFDRGQPPHLIDAATGADLTDPNESLRVVSISPDGRFIATGGCGVAIWNRETMERVAQYPQIGLALAWSPDGSRLAAGASFGVYIWDLPLTSGSTATVHVIHNDTLNVRGEATLNGEILEKLDDGAVVTLIEGPVAAEGYSWWRVRTADGVEGWAVEEADGIRTLIP